MPESWSRRICSQSHGIWLVEAGATRWPRPSREWTYSETQCSASWRAFSTRVQESKTWYVRCWRERDAGWGKRSPKRSQKYEWRTNNIWRHYLWISAHRLEVVDIGHNNFQWSFWIHFCKNPAWKLYVFFSWRMYSSCEVWGENAWVVWTRKRFYFIRLWIAKTTASNVFDCAQVVHGPSFSLFYI